MRTSRKFGRRPRASGQTKGRRSALLLFLFGQVFFRLFVNRRREGLDGQVVEQKRSGPEAHQADDGLVFLLLPDEGGIDSLGLFRVQGRGGARRRLLGVQQQGVHGDGVNRNHEG